MHTTVPMATRASYAVNTRCTTDMISRRYFDHNPIDFMQHFQSGKYPFRCCFHRHLPGNVANPKIIPMLSTGDPAHKCWTHFRHKNCCVTLATNSQILSDNFHKTLQISIGFGAVLDTPQYPCTLFLFSVQTSTTTYISICSTIWTPKRLQ